MKRIVVRNMGVIDVDYLTKHGCSGKEAGKGYAGKFGTGLKYAACFALRENIQMQVYAGPIRYEYYLREKQLHKMHKFVMVRGYIGETPSTDPIDMQADINNGVSDWGDTWAIMREIFQNAKDESLRTGMSFSYSVTEEEPFGEEGHTKVYIQLTDRFQEVLNNMDTYLKLTNENRLAVNEEFGCLYPNTDDKAMIYQNGIWIGEIQDYKSKYHYDLTTLKLTDARTIDLWSLRYELPKLISRMPLSIKADILKFASKHFGSDHRTLEGDAYSSEFINKEEWAIAFKTAFPDHYLCSRNATVAKRMADRGFNIVCLPSNFEDILRNEGVPCENDILGANASDGELVIEPIRHQKSMIKVAVKLTQKIMKKFFMKEWIAWNRDNGYELFDTKIKVYDASSSARFQRTLGKVVNDNDGRKAIWIAESQINGDQFEELVNTIFHEYLHIISDLHDDCQEITQFVTKGMVRWAIGDKVYMFTKNRS